MLELLGAVVFILGLGASIALHEIGHLLPAKRFGVRVSQYMVGFGPTLWSRNKGETEYGIKAIPLGGFIRMIGMFPPNPDGTRPEDARGRFGTMIEEARQDSLNEIAAGEEHRAFYRLSVPRKFTIMFGGPFMNLVLAFVIFTVSFGLVGMPYPSSTIAQVLACVPTDANPSGIASNDGSCGSGQVTPAAIAGIQNGDTLISIAGTEVVDWWSLGEILATVPDESLEIVLLRDGISQTVSVNPVRLMIDDYDETGLPTGTQSEVSFIGVAPEIKLGTQSITSVPGFMFTMAKDGAQALFRFPISVAETASNLFSSQERDPNGPVSVIGMGRISGDIVSDEENTAAMKLSSYLNLLGSMNMFLFLFNLLPILPLDGGHIAGALYEGTRRRFSRLRGKVWHGHADTAKLLPVAYVVSVGLIGMSLIVMVADIIKPISF